MEQKSWLAVRKEAALEIDPETAEVDWWYAQTVDPYGVHPAPPEESLEVGPEYFARSHGSDVWVWFGDLPEAVCDRLRKRFCADGIPDADQNSYAGFVDGEHWVTLIASFQEVADRHRQPHAVVTARRMAETASVVANDLVMAMFEILEAEYDDAFHRDGAIFPEKTRVWQTFYAMCEQFASGYQPKNATEFVRDLVARLTVYDARP